MQFHREKKVYLPENPQLFKICVYQFQIQWSYNQNKNNVAVLSFSSFSVEGKNLSTEIYVISDHGL